MDDDIYYPNYLQLDKILTAQQPISKTLNTEMHDEMLFITVHQAYELWFKQLLVELNSILAILHEQLINHAQLTVAVSRLHRITVILRLLNQQIDVLETMSAMDFLEFRALLAPSSGSQSFQFRLLETQLGTHRLPEDKSVLSRFKKHHQDLIIQALNKPSLVDLIESWLARMPFLTHDQFDFWRAYQQCVTDSLQAEENKLNTSTSTNIREFGLKRLELNKKLFASLFDEHYYQTLCQERPHSFNFKALRSALFIYLYKDQPVLHMPYQLLEQCILIDELLSQWRYRHALLVKRMIGANIGTGGSTGFDFLINTVTKYKIFDDLSNLSTYSLPRSQLPTLPKALLKKLSFQADV